MGGRARAHGHRGEVAAAGASHAGRRLRRGRRSRGVAARRPHPGVHPGHLDQPRRHAGAASCCSTGPRSTRSSARSPTRATRSCRWRCTSRTAAPRSRSPWPRARSPTTSGTRSPSGRPSREKEQADRTPAQGAHRLMPIDVVRRQDPAAVRAILAARPGVVRDPRGERVVRRGGRPAAVVPRGRRRRRHRRRPARRALSGVPRAAPDRGTSRPASAGRRSRAARGDRGRPAGGGRETPRGPHRRPVRARTRATRSTRRFYLASGFVAMNELQRIDWNGPTLILVKPL